MDTAITLFFNGSENLYLDGVAMLGTKAWIWVPLYLAVIYAVVREHDLKHILWIFLGIALCVLLSDQISSTFVKPMVARFRPTHEPEIMNLVDVVNNYRGGKYGFFSSHASNTMAIATYLSLIFRQRHTTIVLVLWSLFNCWTRLYLGVHYFGDIMVGLLVGMLIGSFVYWLFTLKMKDKERAHYSFTRLSVITYGFLFTLIIISIPWKLYY